MNIKETPVLNVLHPEALVTLSQEYHRAYQENCDETKTLESHRDEYKLLKNRLQTLPDRISYDALIPLGSKALAVGKIIHTNEILCLLGDNYFLECSAKSATEIVDRRIKRCEDLLKARNEEGTRLENWKSTITKVILDTGENETMDIVEEVDEEKYLKLKAEHRENVRSYRQGLVKEREEKSATKKTEEEEFWARLEALELEEDMMKAKEEQTKRLQQKESLKDKEQKEEPQLPPKILPSMPKPSTSNTSEAPRKISLFKQRKTMNDQ